VRRRAPSTPFDLITTVFHDSEWSAGALVVVSADALPNAIVRDPAFRHSRSYIKDWSAREL
jgi:hypothetical protein